MAEEPQVKTENEETPVIVEEQTPVVPEKEAEKPVSKEVQQEPEIIRDGTRVTSVDVGGVDSLRKTEQADLLKRQAAAAEAPSFDSWLEGIKSSGKSEMVGDKIVTPDIIDGATPLELLNWKTEYELSQSAPSQDPFKAQPFTTAAGDFDELTAGEILNPAQYSQAERNHKVRKSVRKDLVAAGLESDVAGILTNDLILGSGYMEITQRLAEGGRFLGVSIPDFLVSTLPPTFVAMYKSGSLFPSGPAFRAEFEVASDNWRSDYASWRDGVVNNMSASSMADYYNEGVHNILERYQQELTTLKEEGVPETSWPVHLRDFDYEALAFERAGSEFLTDESGEKIKRRFVSEAQAYDIMDATFNSLPKTSQAGVIVGEEAFYAIATGGSGAIMSGSAKIAKIKKFKTDPRYAKKNEDGVVIGHMLDGVDDPEQIARIVSEFETVDTTSKFFKIGMAQERTSQQLRSVNSRINEITKETVTLKGKSDSDMITYTLPDGGQKTITAGKYRQQLDGELNQLRQIRLRAFATGRVLPYVKDVTEASVAIGIGTALGREYLGFENPDTNEAMSNLVMSLGGYRLIQHGGKFVTQKSVRGVSKASKKVPVASELVRDIVSGIPLVGPIVVDKTVDNMEIIRGVKFTAEERQVAGNIVHFYKNMEPNMRTQSLQVMAEGFKLHEGFIAKFRPEKQARIRELLSESFAHTSGILSLVAAGELNRGKIDLTTLSRYDLADMEDDLRGMESSFRLAEAALEEMIEMSTDTADASTRKLIEATVNMKREGLARLRADVDAVNRQRLDALDDLEKYVISKTDEGIEPETMSTLRTYRGALSKSLGDIIDDTEMFRKQRDALDENIDTSIKQAREMRNKPEHKGLVNKAFETVFRGAASRLELRGKQIYGPAIKFAESQDPLDLKPLVLTLAEGGDIKGIARFFGRESELFTGKEGQQAREALTDIFHEAYSPTMVAEIREKLLKGAKGNTFAIDRIKQMDDLDIAVEMMLSPKGGTFNPFMTQNPYNLELIRRAFKKAGSAYTRMGDANNAQVFNSFVNRMDSYLKNQNKALSDKMVETRKAYEIEVGTPTTAGGYLDAFFKGRQRVLATGVKTSGDMKNLYLNNQQPIDIVTGFSNTLKKALMPGAKPMVGEIQEQMQQVMFAVGQYDQKSGQFVFDLTTEEGVKQYRQFRDAFTELLYTELGENLLKSHKKIQGKTNPYPQLTGKKAESLLEAVDEAMDGINVGFIRDANTRKVVTEPAFDLVEAITAHNSFTNALKTQPEVAAAFGKLQDKYNAYRQTSKRQLVEMTADEEIAVNMIEQIMGDFTEVSFYDKFIASGEGGGIPQLEKAFMAVAKRQGIKPKKAKEMFRDVTLTYTINGMYQRAGLTPVAGKTATRGAGQKVDFTLATPEQMLGEMQKEGTRDSLVAVLGQDHFDFLEDTLQIMNDTTYAVSAKGATGDYMEPGFAAKVSRVWNLVKGFVSPVYVASEYMLTAAKAGQINLFKLTVKNKDAAQVIHKMLATPDLMRAEDFDKFEAIATNYLFSELGANGREMNAIDDEGNPFLYPVPAVKEVGKLTGELAAKTVAVPVAAGAAVWDYGMGLVP